MPAKNVGRDAQDFPKLADFVLEQVGERLDDFALAFKLENFSDAVVVRFDPGRNLRSARAALDHVRVECALGQKLNVAGGRMKLANEEVADDLPLLFRIGHAVEGGPKTPRPPAF